MPETTNQAIDIAERLSLVSAHWSPKVVARLNDYEIKVVKVEGEFVWHTHEDTDELFLVVAGELTIQLRDGDVALGPGQLYVVPRGVEHCPIAAGEAHALLIEPTGRRQHRRGRRSAHRVVRRLACLGADADGEPVGSRTDHVAVAQLGTAAGLDRTVDGHRPVGQQGSDLATGLDQVGELEQLAEADALRSDRYLLHDGQPLVSTRGAGKTSRGPRTREVFLSTHRPGLTRATGRSPAS